jgi:predicted AAA+ superfamily ATPase
LSRRLIVIDFDVLDFCEYLIFNKLITDECWIDIKEIFNFPKINQLVLEKLPENILFYRDRYKKWSAYPFAVNSDEKIVVKKLQNILDIAIFEDLPLVFELAPEDIKKVKTFLIELAYSPVFEFSAKKIKEKLNISKYTYYDILKALEKIKLVNIITNFSQKASKI